MRSDQQVDKSVSRERGRQIPDPAAQSPPGLFELGNPTLSARPCLCLSRENPIKTLSSASPDSGFWSKPDASPVVLRGMVRPPHSGNVSTKFFFQRLWSLHDITSLYKLKSHSYISGQLLSSGLLVKWKEWTPNLLRPLLFGFLLLAVIYP